MLKAAISAAEARELLPLKKKVSVEEEAETRAVTLGREYEKARENNRYITYQMGATPSLFFKEGS